MGTFRDHLTRVNRVLARAKRALDGDEYFELLVELLTQVEAELLDQLGDGDAEDEDGLTDDDENPDGGRKETG